MRGNVIRNVPEAEQLSIVNVSAIHSSKERNERVLRRDVKLRKMVAFAQFHCSC